MAVVSLGVPIFKGTEDDDIEMFIDLYIGHLNALGINPLDRVANPSGAKRAMGILRGCMQGSAAIWFDKELTGKNWKIAHIRKQGTAVMNAFRLLNAPEGAGGPNANTYVPHTTALAYATNPAHGAITIGQAFIPDGRLKGGDPLWRRSGGKPTTDDPNILYNGANGNGNPIVLPDILPDQALFWLRDQYTTVLQEKQRLRFGTLSQDNLPIKEYHEKLERSAQLLGFGDEIVRDQFYRGLNPDNILEAERIGIERPMDDLVHILDRVEKRKAEMHLGLAKRKAQEDYYNKSVTPIKAPPVSQQDAVEIKPITQHAITQDMLDKLLNQHTATLTKNFQAQLQTLQDTVSQQSHKGAPPPIPPKDHRRIHEYYEGYNPYEDNRQYTFDDILGDREAQKIVPMVAKALAKARKAEMDHEVDRLATAFSKKVNIYGDGPVPMDIDLIDGSIVLQDANGNEFTAFVTRGSKKK